MEHVLTLRVLVLQVLELQTGGDIAHKSQLRNLVELNWGIH